MLIDELGNPVIASLQHRHTVRNITTCVLKLFPHNFETKSGLSASMYFGRKSTGKRLRLCGCVCVSAFSFLISHLLIAAVVVVYPFLLCMP